MGTQDNIDVFDEISDGDSEIASSGDEYVPSMSDASDTDENHPSTSNTHAAPTKNKKRKRQISDDDPDDNIPLSSLKQKISQQREEDDLEIISQMLDEPSWEDVDITNVDTVFKGITKQLPEGGVKTPYVYFRDLITDAMLENVEFQSNNYALKKVVSS